jgi:hypothetical protein
MLIITGIGLSLCPIIVDGRAIAKLNAKNMTFDQLLCNGKIKSLWYYI